MAQQNVTNPGLSESDASNFLALIQRYGKDAAWNWQRETDHEGNDLHGLYLFWQFTPAEADADKSVGALVAKGSAHEKEWFENIQSDLVWELLEDARGRELLSEWRSRNPDDTDLPNFFDLLRISNPDAPIFDMVRRMDEHKSLPSPAEVLLGRRE